MSTKKKDIRNLDLNELRTYFETIGEPKFRATQVHEWLWKKNAHSFADMTNLSKELREKLIQHFDLLPIQVPEVQRSKDGTIKNAVRLHDGNVVESVLIPTPSRTTACVSSQVGCSLDCTFCATASLKRMRNLSAGEIVDQVALIDRQSQDFHGHRLSNIVFMGMGEPLLNFKEVQTAIQKITSPDGLGMSPRRITVSTSGVSKMIVKLADAELGINLALSLHSAIEETRNRIMPFTVKFPLDELIESLKYWYAKTGKRVTLEYIVWKGVNDNEHEIQALVDFAWQIPTKINLIEYNAIEGEPYQKASNRWVNRYVEVLEHHGLIVNIRRSRGKDIDAACGQLANKNEVVT